MKVKLIFLVFFEIKQKKGINTQNIFAVTDTLN